SVNRQKTPIGLYRIPLPPTAYQPKKRGGVYAVPPPKDMMSASSSTASTFDQFSMYFPPSTTFNYSSYSTPMQSPSFFPNMGYPSPMSVQTDNSSTSLEKKRSRKYKTPSPQVLRLRRTAANERERKRMNHLNVAYDKLRTVLPEIDSGRRLSKFETLQMAQEYINSLAEILRDPTSPESVSPAGQSSSQSNKHYKKSL
ncbi:unnamed protein product, partial [Auanema sp. JU1783]